MVLTGGRVVGEGEELDGEVVVVGSHVVAVGPAAAGVVPAGARSQVVDCSGAIVMPAIVDGHCHPLGGGGGGGPQTQSLPLLLEDFWVAGVGCVVGVLGHDTVTRSLESLLVRVRALRLLGLPAFALAGEIAFPSASLTGSCSRDLSLIDHIVGVKTSLGEAVSPRTPEHLLGLYADVVRGARSAGKRTHLHLHLGEDADALELVERVLETGRVDPSHLTLTHVNWNESVLDRAGRLMAQGVQVDVTACITPEYFPGSVEPSAAVEHLLQRDPAGSGVSVSSDAGGSHVADGRLLLHEPMLLLGVLRRLLAAGTVSPTVLGRVFAGTTVRRLGLPSASAVVPGANASLVVVPRDGVGPISLVVEGTLVVDNGASVSTDPIGRAVPPVPPAEGAR
jgi:beta-aspartyl-dipeptidase (metallo-type)